MKKILLLSLVCMLWGHSRAQEENLLSKKYSLEELGRLLIRQDDWRPFPLINDRAGWARAHEETLRAILVKAESYLSYQWPYIPATKSLLIERTGDRDEYQRVSFEKRRVLGTLLLAEIYENQGRFLDQIVDGVWSICEESWWGVPAHLPKTRQFSGLVDTSDPFVDLFAAETATYLAWVDYFLGAKLDAISPQIRKRIYNETNYRILKPLMTKHHGWMGGKGSGRPNNWNPWICSNWLNTVLLIEKDETKRVQAVARVLEVLDNFLNPYPQDGGCDEGPGYWGAAAASLYDNLALLNVATDSAFADVFENEKVKNMAKFIYRAQIGEKYFLNFADASPTPQMSASMIYRFGKDIGDDDMMRFGAFYRHPPDGSISTFHYFRNLFSVFIEEEFQKAPQGLPLPQDVWLPDLQVMVARDKAGSTEGFFVGAKGGHNAESHNHNDIGNYVVYYDGIPVLIDVGSGTYTRRTFSNQRYDIWFNRSDYHNVPTINGATQAPGVTYRSSDVQYSSNASSAELTLDIAHAYPEDFGVEHWIRSIRLTRGKSVRITDDAKLRTPSTVVQHLMTCYPAEVLKPGEVVIHYRTEKGMAKDFIVRYDGRKLKVTVEKVVLQEPEDRGIRANWGDNIYRINFVGNATRKTEQYRFEISEGRSKT